MPESNVKAIVLPPLTLDQVKMLEHAIAVLVPQLDADGISGPRVEEWRRLLRIVRTVTDYYAHG